MISISTDHGSLAAHRQSGTDPLKPWASKLILVTLLLSSGLGQPAVALQLGDATKFATLRENIRQLEREVSKKFSAMPIGFPDQQQLALQEIEGLKSQLDELRKQMDQSAIDSYTADAARNPAAASHIMQMAIACLEGQGSPRPFDPARTYELASLLGKGGQPSPQILNMAYQACLALQDFERCERILKRLEGQGVTIPEVVIDHLEKLKKSWAKELAKREQDEQRGDLPRVKFETDLGDIILELYEDDSPQTVANFISLVESGFYDDTAFFEVKPGNMARGGCPNGNGTGDPGYHIANELTSAESRRFFAGTLGMYHEGVNTTGSQFFISYQIKSDFDLNFVAFGRIIEGLEVLYQLPRTEPTQRAIDTSNPPKIKRATVLRKRDHAYEPVKLPTLPSLEKIPDPIKPDLPGNTSGVPDVAPQDDGG